MNVSDILSLLSNFRYLFQDIIENEHFIIDNLSKCSFSNEKIFPCDFIDLRKILSNMEIEFCGKIPLLSQNFANRYLNRYTIFLVIDISKIDCEIFNYKGLTIIQNNKLDIRDSLKRIVINKSKENDIYNRINSLLSNLKINVECIVSNTVPGLSSPNPYISIQKGIL